jgi:hypothetical protein
LGSEDNCPTVICLSTEQTPTSLSHTFIHELLHAANRHYNCGKIEEAGIQQLSNGMHQALEGLGIRFVRRK